MRIGLKQVVTMLDDRHLVYVVDSDVKVRESLKGLIHQAGLRAFGFASAEEFLSHPLELGPSCLILETALPGLDGLGLQQQLVNGRADLPIIFIAATGDVVSIVRAMKAGAMEFLVKPVSSEAVLQAIGLALDHSRSLRRAALEIGELRERYAGLSKREREVMSLVVSGIINKIIGAELGISEVTVKTHRGQAMRKMRAQSLAELVMFAAKLGISQDLCRRSMEARRRCPDQNEGIKHAWGSSSKPRLRRQPATHL